LPPKAPFTADFCFFFCECPPVRMGMGGC
jgi:hypothetical protein